jgi:DNA (cytosine-5)-methyltransferase 1
VFVDLFAGAGGWDVAARRLGMSPVGYELDDAACATRHAAGLLTEQCDVAAVQLATWTVRVVGMMASPPCQAFSAGGKGLGRGADVEVCQHVALGLAAGDDLRPWAQAHLNDARSILVVEPLRWALALRPTWLAWEQVPPVLAFWEFCAPLLRQVGYHVWTGCLHAEQYGVPQTRRRAFLMASLAGPVATPTPTHSAYHTRSPARLDSGVAPWISMADALGWPDALVGFPRRAETGPRGGATTIAIEGIEYRARDLRPTSRPALALSGKARSWTRLRLPPTVGGTHGAVAGRQVNGHINLTVAEASLLQTFPADYPWRGSRTSQFQQVGNAVPPDLATVVLCAVTRPEPEPEPEVVPMLPRSPLQGTIDGTWVSLPITVPKRLTERQRDLLRSIQQYGQISTRDACRFFADPSAALSRLVALGLIERKTRGTYVPRVGKD